MPIGARLPELLLLLVLALLVFGPKKLPEIGASLGKSINAFKNGMKTIADPDSEKEGTPEQKLLEQKRLELEALDRDLASRKAAASTYEAAQADPVEVSVTESRLD
jgi:sec-independent protein translocase protein TatA